MERDVPIDDKNINKLMKGSAIKIFIRQSRMNELLRTYKQLEEHADVRSLLGIYVRDIRTKGTLDESKEEDRKFIVDLFHLIDNEDPDLCPVLRWAAIQVFFRYAKVDEEAFDAVVSGQEGALDRLKRSIREEE